MIPAREKFQEIVILISNAQRQIYQTQHSFAFDRKRSFVIYCILCARVVILKVSINAATIITVYISGASFHMIWSCLLNHVLITVKERETHICTYIEICRY